MTDEHDPTDGLTLREILLELRADVKVLTQQASTKPSRGEVYSVLAGVATLAMAFAGLFLK